MSLTVDRLLSEALLLPADSRTELVETILEQSAPSEECMAEQLAIVAGRMENVRNGTALLLPAEEAHHQVLRALRTRK